jgi:hypothetical protein
MTRTIGAAIGVVLVLLFFATLGQAREGVAQHASVPMASLSHR